MVAPYEEHLQGIEFNLLFLTMNIDQTMDRLRNPNGGNEDLEKLDKPIPFKLCFLDRHVLGQSHIKIGKSLTLAPIVAPKFYDTKNEELDEGLVEKYVEILKKEQSLDKSSLPKTENQRYGWYQVRLTDADPTDRRLYAHKRTNIIVREHLMNYAKIRK